MKRSFAMLFAVSAVIVAFDIWTKAWATRELAGSPPVQILGDVVRFTYARNRSGVRSRGGLAFPYYLFSIARGWSSLSVRDPAGAEFGRRRRWRSSSAARSAT